jgi:hypothetical protein
VAAEFRVTRTARLLGQSLDVLLWVFMGALASFTLALHLGVLTGVGLGAIAAAAVCGGIGLALGILELVRRGNTRLPAA